MPYLGSVRYCGSLDTWTAVCLTAAKFKPFVFSVRGFALPNVANIFIVIICDDGPKSKSKSLYDWRSVSLSVLVSSPVRGSWPDISYRLTVSVLSWGGRPLWWEGGSVLCQSVGSNESIVDIYIYLHFTCLPWCFIYNIYKASVSPGQAQQIMPYLVAFATATV
jgi:hypothetical protein